MCLLGYIITCGYITSENSSQPRSRKYSVVLNKVQAIAGLIYESKLPFGKKEVYTVGDRVQMIRMLMEMKCTEKLKHLEQKYVPFPN